MDLARPDLRPDPSLSRAEMEALQRDIAAAAVFADDGAPEPAAVAVDEGASLADGLPPAHDGAQERLGTGAGPADAEPQGGGEDAPTVVGVDQAFLTDRADGRPDAAVSAAVALRGGTVVEYASATTPLSIPYVPGLLAFREGEPILAALDALDADPDLLVCDGSGRIHYREAGLATHVGVLRDVPSVGVAKSLLCGEPDEATDERPEGWRTPIRADEAVTTAEPGTVIGHALQSRQYPNSRRVNPLYVSPGHRVSAETAVALVAALCAGYKLPEPTRLADAHAERAKRDAE
ncbi:endonuclease V [Halorubrum sp. Atlit-8R]|uniref:endonuclease V n=1 Tax=unclassified Halorubrum TaxID=2642239 RepID=UPI000EF21B9E|nr:MULTISPECIES: endonuclease V [unclassified Halorubrum]RLM71255.1 endonuclease V [Halorubrum sp. Atlit-9R]RLM72123.1 endonuclease V [Halorubrum sp. Atlit-9R]RLM82592.1 endonuclease V [Halorubrum sp. Atlit-8R]